MVHVNVLSWLFIEPEVRKILFKAAAPNINNYSVRAVLLVLEFTTMDDIVSSSITADGLMALHALTNLRNLHKQTA